eukprot:jgi/Picsp_1/6307/NSC_03656-R1_amino acid permease
MDVSKDTFSIKYPDGKYNGKKGSLVTTALHVFSIMVGPGVLALPSAASWLGWVFGPILLTLFYVTCLLVSSMLVSVYEVNGVFHSRYHHAVRHILSPSHALAVSIVQLIVLLLVCISRVITAARAMQNVSKLVCTHSGCFSSYAAFCAIFGGVEILLSVVPSLEEASWISVFGSSCSMVYLLITIVLGFIKAGNLGGTAFGRSSSTADKAFNVMASMGNVMQSYTCAQLLMEIQDTLRQPGAASKTMRKSLAISQTVGFVFYAMVMTSGYLAFGNDVSGLILSSFYSPVWLVSIANTLLAINMLASFQLLAQGIFETVESHIKMHLLRRKAEKEGLDVDAALTGSISDDLDPIAEAEQEAMADEEKPKRQPPRFAELRNIKSYKKYNMSMGFNKVHEIGVEKRAYSRLSMSMRRPSTATTNSGGVRASKRYTTDFEDFQDSMSLIKHSSTMMRLNTGLANEEVPENAEHFLVPAWIRSVSRTLYVLIATGLGICLPNFTAFIGFLGAFKCAGVASLFLKKLH